MDADRERRPRFEAANARGRRGGGAADLRQSLSDEWLLALERLGTDWRKPHIEDAPYVIVVFEQAYGLEDGDKVKH